jgi:hypothetical protein
MKQSITIAIGAIFFYALASSFSAGIAAPPHYYNRTGAGGSSTDCAGSGCHNANNSNLGLEMYLINIVTGDTIKSNGVSKLYIPNTPYKIKVVGILQTSGYPIFGYQFAGQKADGYGAGIYFSTPGLQSNVVSLYEIVEPVQPRITTGLRCVDSINWISPSKNSGHVTLFLTMLAANANTLSNGDIGNNASFDYEEGPTSVNDFSSSVETQIFPNPAHEEVSFTINHAEKGAYQYVVLNQFGSIVKQENMDVEQDSFTKRLELENYPPGTYWLYLTKSGKQRTLQFLKL